MCAVNSEPLLKIPLEDGEPALLFRRVSGLSTQNYLSLCSQQPFEAERRGGQPHWSCGKKLELVSTGRKGTQGWPFPVPGQTLPVKIFLFSWPCHGVEGGHSYPR